jgi:hypothetical protein
MAQYGIDDAPCDDLPRGVIIGSVELYDCDEGDNELDKRLTTSCSEDRARPIAAVAHPPNRGPRTSTTAMAAGLSERVWTLGDLLAAAA